MYVNRVERRARMERAEREKEEREKEKEKWIDQTYYVCRDFPNNWKLYV